MTTNQQLTLQLKDGKANTARLTNSLKQTQTQTQGETMRRMNVNKNRSAKKFSRKSGRTKAANIAPPPMRGGYRL